MPKFSNKAFCFISLFLACFIFSCTKTNEIVEQTYKDGSKKVVIIYKEQNEIKEPIEERRFYEDGSLQMRGKLKEKQRDGIWTSWYPNGNKWSEVVFMKGKEHGKKMVWYENGNLYFEGYYKQGNKVKTWHFYDSLGNHLKSHTFTEN